MDLTPRDIQQKQFHDAFRGYAHEEVDLFLDEVAAAFDRVFRENQEFHHRLKELEEELTKARGSEDMLKRMLVTAQETADKAVQEAKAKAQEMVSSSDAQAKRIVTDAEAKSQQILTEARAKAEQIVAGAVSKERQLQVSIEGMKAFDAEYRARLKAFIHAQLDQLEAGPDLPEEPKPMGAGAADAAHGPASDPPVSSALVEEPAASPPGPAPSSTSGPGPAVVSPTTASSPGPEQPPLRPAMVTVPEARTQGEASEEIRDEDERSIRELFWGDD